MVEVIDTERGVEKDMWKMHGTCGVDMIKLFRTRYLVLVLILFAQAFIKRSHLQQWHSIAPALGAEVASSIVVAVSSPLVYLLSPPETHCHGFSYY